MNSVSLLRDPTFASIQEKLDEAEASCQLIPPLKPSERRRMMTGHVVGTPPPVQSEVTRRSPAKPAPKRSAAIGPSFYVGSGCSETVSNGRRGLSSLQQMGPSSIRPAAPATPAAHGPSAAAATPAPPCPRRDSPATPVDSISSVVDVSASTHSRPSDVGFSAAPLSIEESTKPRPKLMFHSLFHVPTAFEPFENQVLYAAIPQTVLCHSLAPPSRMSSFRYSQCMDCVEDYFRVLQENEDSVSRCASTLDSLEHVRLFLDLVTADVSHRASRMVYAEVRSGAQQLQCINRTPFAVLDALFLRLVHLQAMQGSIFDRLLSSHRSRLLMDAESIVLRPGASAAVVGSGMRAIVDGRRAHMQMQSDKLRKDDDHVKNDWLPNSMPSIRHFIRSRGGPAEGFQAWRSIAGIHQELRAMRVFAEMLTEP